MERTLVLVSAFTLICGSASGEPSYTGYSGAPGSSGSCASTCHGSSGGTIQVAGFPTSYTPGQAYVVSIFHQGGSSISNFNASVREGAGSVTAGEIAAGYRTSTYSRTNEPNGVHFTSSGRDSGTFTWTAPDPGVGDVRLYLAGLQGSSMSGRNTEIVLVSSPATGLADESIHAAPVQAFELRPSVVTEYTVFHMSGVAGRSASLTIVNSAGRIVDRLPSIEQDGRAHSVVWQAYDADGNRMPAGTYLAVLRAGVDRLVRKFTIE